MNVLEKPLEKATPELIEEVVAIEEQCRADLKNLEAEADGIRAKLIETVESIAQIQSLEREVAVLRQERQERLAADEEHQDVTGKIKAAQSKLQDIQDDFELLQDTKAGLERRLEGVESEIARKRLELAEAMDQIPLVHYMAAANAYNKAAKVLASTTEAFWTTYRAIPERVLLKQNFMGSDSTLRYSIPCPHEDVGWLRSALALVPILRMGREWRGDDGKALPRFFFNSSELK